MSDDALPRPADIRFVMVDLIQEPPGEAEIGGIRLPDWQVCRVGPLPASRDAYDGYLIRAGYDLDIWLRGQSLSWFEIGLAFGDASVTDVVPRTVVQPQQPISYVLNDSLHFVRSDRPGLPGNLHLPAVEPFVDVFGLGGPEIRLRHAGGVQPGSHTTWMMVLAPAGTERLAVKVTARYDIFGAGALGSRPVARPRRLELDLTACRAVPDAHPILPADRTELTVSGSPRVLIAYTHDSPGHVRSVLQFAELLCERGIDTHLDRWDNDDQQDWYLWALDNVTKADFILVIASPQCRTAGEGQTGSAASRDARPELSILRDRLMDDRVAWLPRILPVVLPGGSAQDIPLFLNPRYTGHYSIASFTVSGADGLLRTLTRGVSYERPSVSVRTVQLRPPVVGATLGDLDTA